MPKKKITIEDLAQMMSKGFAEAQHQMWKFEDKVDKRFTQVDKRFTQVDKRFSQVDKRFSQVDKRFSQVDKRFAQVDKRFEIIDTRIVGLRQEMRERFGVIDQKIDKLYTIMDGFVKLYDTHDKELTALKAQFDRLEQRLVKLEARLRS